MGTLAPRGEDVMKAAGLPVVHVRLHFLNLLTQGKGAFLLLLPCVRRLGGG